MCSWFPKATFRFFILILFWRGVYSKTKKIYELQRRKRVPYDICAKRRLKSACAFAQSDESLRCPLKETASLAISKCTQWRFRSDSANAQADLNLHWEHMSKGTFPTHGSSNLDVAKQSHSHSPAVCPRQSPVCCKVMFLFLRILKLVSLFRCKTQTQLHSWFSNVVQSIIVHFNKLFSFHLNIFFLRYIP